MEPQSENANRIITDDFSNPASKALYYARWQNEPEIAEKLYENGRQCGGCSFFAPFNEDWGLCCHPDSRHHLETVFEHFTCPSHVDDGWDAHRFLTDLNREALDNSERRYIAIDQLVAAYINANDLGVVIDRKTDYIPHANSEPLSADLGFITKNRAIKTEGNAYLLAPDLAIKIVTTSDNIEWLNFTIMSFLEAGTQQVWVVHPIPLSRNIHVYGLTTDLDIHVSVLTNKDTLDGGDLLPGFRIPVQEAFQRRR